MRKNTKLLILLLLTAFCWGQEGNWFYATMESQSALALKQNNPDGIQILATEGNQSAVFVEEEVAHQLHRNIITHGPGFIFKSDADAAISAINRIFARNYDILEFTIDQDALVNQCLGLVNPENIEETILDLVAYGTRFHTKPQAEQAVLDMKAKWEAMVTAAGRTDITFRIVEHENTPMPSLIMTIEGSESPDEYVIVGGHIDSITWNTNDAPGADDNASGIASITEMIRILLDVNYKPLRTVEFMAYAAEEIGLVGSDEIAQEYYNACKNVIAYVQFDMTNYNGSVNDIYIIEDQYTSNELNLYLIELLEHYNTSGSHALTYGSSACNYGCSDHASWKERGYLASFPFEASFNDSNPFIHTPNDEYSVSGNSEHAAKFTKLGLEFIIETAKSSTLSTHEFSNANLSVVVKDRNLIYNIEDLGSKIQSMSILDAGARKVISKSNLDASGSVSLNGLSQGFYIAVFKAVNGQTFTKKFLVK